MSTIKFEAQQGAGGGGGGGVEQEYVDAHDALTLQASKDYTDSVAAGKVDKESGKGLSANDFTDAASTTVSRLNGAYVTGVSNTSTASSVSLGYTTINPSTGDTATASVMLPIAAEGVSGIMDAATYGTVQTNASNIDAILSGAVSVTGLSANPTQSELTTAWQAATSLTTVINGAKINDPDNQKVWTYYTNTATWYAATNTAQVTVNTATNTSKGIVQGEASTAGMISVDGSGQMSVNGWSSLVNTVGTNTTNIASKADASSLSTVATSGLYSDLSGTPNLAAVATSGAYSDLSGTPTVPTFTVTDTDPGAGGALTTGDFIIVYEA